MRLKCVVLSIGFLFVLSITKHFFYLLLLPNWSHIGNGGVAMYSFLIYLYLSYAILFANAAFTVTKLTDIVNFDVVTSKNKFWLVYAHFNISIHSIFVLVIIIMSSSTIYYN